MGSVAFFLIAIWPLLTWSDQHSSILAEKERMIGTELEVGVMGDEVESSVTLGGKGSSLSSSSVRIDSSALDRPSSSFKHKGSHHHPRVSH